MQGWQTPYLGLRDLPRELTEFELQAFFSFSRAELELIERRRGDNHMLGLARIFHASTTVWPEGSFRRRLPGPTSVLTVIG